MTDEQLKKLRELEEKYAEKRYCKICTTTKNVDGENVCSICRGLGRHLKPRRKKHGI